MNNSDRSHDLKFLFDKEKSLRSVLSTVFFLEVSVFAFLGVVTTLKYSLFFANISLCWIYSGLLAIRTCCLSLVDVSKLKKYHTLGRKGSKKRKAFSMFQKSLLSKFF